MLEWDILKEYKGDINWQVSTFNISSVIHTEMAALPIFTFTEIKHMLKSKTFGWYNIYDKQLFTIWRKNNKATWLLNLLHSKLQQYVVRKESPEREGKVTIVKLMLTQRLELGSDNLIIRAVPSSVKLNSIIYT